MLWTPYVQGERSNPEGEANISTVDGNLKYNIATFISGGRDIIGSPHAPPRKSKKSRRLPSLRETEGEDLSEEEAEYIQPKEHIPQKIPSEVQQVNAVQVLPLSTDSKCQAHDEGTFVFCSALFGLDNTPVTDL